MSSSEMASSYKAHIKGKRILVGWEMQGSFFMTPVGTSSSEASCTDSL